MAIVRVDSQRRIYIPKEIALEGEEVMIIPYSSSFLVVPIPRGIVEIETRKSRRELKDLAEERARREALARARRRKQLSD